MTSPRLGVDALLGHLERVHRSGRGWRADCPNNHKTRGSLSVSQGDDGRILLHCFVGCGASDVLGALGLSMTDVMPERLRDPSPEARRAARASFRLASVTAAAGVLSFEAQIVADCACQIVAGCRLSEADHLRTILAVERIGDIRAVLS